MAKVGKPSVISSPQDGGQETVVRYIDQEGSQVDEMKQVAIDEAKAKLRGVKQDTEERKTYANKIFKLICVWLLAVFGILVAQGSDCGFELSDAVLLALIGGTTANVLGIFIIVAQYLFPKR